MKNKPTNILLVGVGGQGIILASEIMSDVFLEAGFDVKKSEVHGMAQRGGSVASDVRFGAKVDSPMVPDAAADYVVVLEETQVEVNRPRLAPGGTLLDCTMIPADALVNRRSLNVAMLGILSRHLDIPQACWKQAICQALPEKLHAVNLAAFETGRRIG